MLATAPLLLASLLPQGPDEVLATFVIDGKPAAVTRTDAALWLARHERHSAEAKDALAHLVNTTLIRRVATERSLMPTVDEARAYWRELQRQLRAVGERPEDSEAVRNTTEAQWLDDIAVQVALERIVRAELGLSKQETASPDMQKLWLQEQRKKTKVVDDADELPPGTAVRLGDTDVPLIDLGLLLLRKAKDDHRRDTVARVALATMVEAVARAEGIQITPVDLDAAVEKHRRETAADPRFRGLTFEAVLKTQGLTIAALRDRRTFRAQLLLDKLARRRFPDAQLATELAADRQGMLDRLGARRQIGVIFVRALAEPNGLIPRDFDAASKHLESVRDRLAAETFAHVARVESEHASSKLQGGDTGGHRRRSERLPEPVLAAAFALPAGEVSQPLRTDDGCFLVKVLDVEPEPTDDVLLARLRDAKALELKQKLLADAKLELTGSAKVDDAAAPKDAPGR
jgi:hypothetical protein